MKFFALLLFFAAMVLVAAFELEHLQKCGHCYEENSEHLICSKAGKGTFFNECVMICMDAELLHEGPCNERDLLESQAEEK